MQCSEKKLLYEAEAPGLVYLTLDNYDPIYVGFQHKVKVEILLTTASQELKVLNTILDDQKTKELDSIPHKQITSETNTSCNSALKSLEKLLKKEPSEDSCGNSGDNGSDNQDEDTEEYEQEEEEAAVDIDMAEPNITSSEKTADKDTVVESKVTASQQMEDQDVIIISDTMKKEVEVQVSSSAKSEPQAVTKSNAITHSNRFIDNRANAQRRSSTPVVTEKKNHEKLKPVASEVISEEPTELMTTVSAKYIIRKAEEKVDDSGAASSQAGERTNCVYCDTMFPSKKEFYRHRRVQSSRYHMCLKCQTAFPYKAYLLVHVKFHDEENTKDKYLCWSCTYEAKTVAELKRHFLVHTGESCFQCCRCQKTFVSQSQLLKHLDSHRPKGLFKCSCCNQFFSSRAELTDHKAQVRKYKCAICGQEFPQHYSYFLHLKTNHQETVIRCDQCPKVFDTKDALKRHKVYHRFKKKEKCPVCGISVNRLNKHLKVHKSIEELTESELFLCDQCPARKKTESALRAHKEIHSKTVIKCHLCDHVCKRKSGLSRHIFNVHHDSWPHQCEVCGKRCKNNANLKVHMRIHSDTKAFPCSYCDQGFNYKSSLEGHMRSKHPEKIALRGMMGLPAVSSKPQAPVISSQVSQSTQPSEMSSQQNTAAPCSSSANDHSLNSVSQFDVKEEDGNSSTSDHLSTRHTWPSEDGNSSTSDHLSTRYTWPSDSQTTSQTNTSSGLYLNPASAVTSNLSLDLLHFGMNDDGVGHI